MATEQDMEAMAALLNNPMAMGGPMGMPVGPSVQPIESADLELEDDIADDDLTETLSERLWGLTEMFPESVRSFTSGVASFSWSTSKTLYTLGCSGVWVVASSAAILALPIMFETERAQMEEQQMQQQRQILLGPNAAVSGPAVAGGVLPPR